MIGYTKPETTADIKDYMGNLYETILADFELRPQRETREAWSRAIIRNSQEPIVLQR